MALRDGDAGASVLSTQILSTSLPDTRSSTDLSDELSSSASNFSPSAPSISSISLRKRVEDYVSCCSSDIVIDCIIWGIPIPSFAGVVYCSIHDGPILPESHAYCSVGTGTFLAGALAVPLIMVLASTSPTDFTFRNSAKTKGHSDRKDSFDIGSHGDGGSDSDMGDQDSGQGETSSEMKVAESDEETPMVEKNYFKVSSTEYAKYNQAVKYMYRICTFFGFFASLIDTLLCNSYFLILCAVFYVIALISWICWRYLWGISKPEIEGTEKVLSKDK